jgi:nucleolar protein 58
MEVIWGIKNLMKSLVPDEDSELSEEERLQMSLGMETVLTRHGIVATPEMVRSPSPILSHDILL